MADRGCGFAEIHHTADWALRIWAPSLPLLFAQAAKGMYWLMETTLAGSPRTVHTIEVQGADAESLLVAFLSELLYLSESAGMGFDQFEVIINGSRLRANARGAPVQAQKKEIKAVTYHYLAIRREEETYTVTIVFDV